MSKHIYWFALAAAGLFAAACSDNDALDSSSAVSDGSSTFMAVNIYMTSDAATRSSSTVSGGGFSTGSSTEYAIDLNSSIFLFYDSNGDFLTSTTEVTSNGGSETSGTDVATDYVEYTYSAMLVLGPTTLTPTYVVGIFNDAKAQTAYDGLSLDKLKEALFDSDNELEATDDNAGILMSNAVKYTTSDGFSFATEISEDNICSTSDAALASPVEMYIERAKAKVEIGITEDNFTSNEDGTYTYTIMKTGDNSETDSTFTYYYVDKESGEIIPVTGATVDITINGWAVNALNKTGYVIKNYSNDDGTELSSDITSSSKGGAWSSDWYSSLRIFWAVDGNYEASEDEDWALQYATWATVKEAGCSTDGAYYYEQTLDPNATTGYIAGKTAYAPTLLVAATVGVSATNATEADDSSDDADDIFLWYGSVLYSKQAVYARILSTLSSIEEVSLEEGETISSIEWETDDASKGSVYIKSITMSNNTDVSTFIDQVNSSSLINYSEETSSSSTLRRYNGGACYYQVPIQTYISTSSTTDHPYGLVRNTAYSITINSVTGIGGGVNDPNEDELTEIPGEDTNYFVGAKINILAWRLSSQSVDL